MIKVGLTGGYATGKSSVAKELESLGCFLIYADKLGHQVLEPTGRAYPQVINSFGKNILALDETIDRKKLAALVFSDADLLKQLTNIVHPAVFELEEEALNGFESQNAHGIAVIEAAILIETGRYKQFNKVIVTTCKYETQIERGMERDHLSRDQVVDRLSRQISQAEAIRFANYVIDTERPPAETLSEVRRIHSELRQLTEAPLP